MIECIDLSFDHILLASISNRKRNRESDDVVDEAAANIISSKRSSGSTGSNDSVLVSKSNIKNVDVLTEGDVVCTVIKASTGSKKCIHNKNTSYCKDCGGGGICQHQRQRSQCKDCGGSQICQHDRVRVLSLIHI